MITPADPKHQETAVTSHVSPESSSSGCKLNLIAESGDFASRL